METKKTHWKKLHNPDFLGAYSLDNGNGFNELNVQFTSVRNEEVAGVDGKKADCIVGQIKGQKPMILNATNCKKLTKIFKSVYIEDWTTGQVTIYVDKVKAFGEIHDALRIKEYKPPVINPNRALEILNKCTTLTQLNQAWITELSNDEKQHGSVIAKKDELKTKLK